MNFQLSASKIIFKTILDDTLKELKPVKIRFVILIIKINFDYVQFLFLIKLVLRDTNFVKINLFVVGVECKVLVWSHCFSVIVGCLCVLR